MDCERINSQARIQALFERVRCEHPQISSFEQFSIGMPGDWPLDYGATLIRLGTAIFGERVY